MGQKPQKLQRSFTVEDFFSLPTIFIEIEGSLSSNPKKFLPTPIKFLGPYLSKAFIILVALVMIHVEILCSLTAYKKFKEEGLEEGFLFFLNSVVYIWVIMILVFHAVKEKKLRDMFIMLNEKLRHRSAIGLTYITIEPGFRMAGKVLNAWQWSCILAASGYALVPLVNGSGQLPMPTWYPFDINTKTRFILMYSVQFFAQTWVAIIFANAMGLCFFVFILFCSQLDILCASIKNIPFTALLKSGMDKRGLLKLQQGLKNTHQEVNQYSIGGDNIELLEDFGEIGPTTSVTKDTFENILIPETFNDLKITKHLKSTIVDCIDHHQTILELMKVFENEMSFFMFLKIGDINLLLTTILFAVTISKDTARRLSFLMYLSIPSFEILFLSLAGQTLTYQSSRIINAFMISPWHLYMLPVRRELSIMLAEGVKPYYLTAGGMLNISTSTLIAVVKASFSYYTLLAKLNKN